MIERFQSFVAGITVCYKCIQRIKAAEMTEFGLKGTHVMCLFYLHQHPEGLTAAQLSALCVEDKGAISRTLADLDGKGYLCGQRKYRTPLHLSPSGEQVASQVDQIIEEWVRAGGDGLTAQEREDFYAALERISCNLKEELDMQRQDMNDGDSVYH